MLKKIVIIMSVIFCMSFGTVFAENTCPLYQVTEYYSYPHTLDKDNWVAVGFEIDSSSWYKVTDIMWGARCGTSGDCSDDTMTTTIYRGTRDQVGDMVAKYQHTFGFTTRTGLPGPLTNKALSPGYYWVAAEVRAGDGDTFSGALQRAGVTATTIPKFSPKQTWGDGDGWYKSDDTFSGSIEVCGDYIAPLDADGNGSVNAASDGMLILRYMFGARGTGLTDGAVDSDCSLCDSAEIENYINYNIKELIYDIDDSGSVDLASDGVLIYRYMFGARGTGLTDGAVDLDNCNRRCDASKIEAYINSLY
ncbi:MAG: hypothetical protein GY795_09465 [Desulfobacterales bacterium]|nr:hypothetical protein [Desulfobacterales bacterium]